MEHRNVLCIVVALRTYVNILYVSDNIVIYDDGFFERFLPPNRVPFSIIINFNNSASVW